ncbi:MAG: MBG domain-containing protein, partial [Gemmatimonadales bacterium]
FTIAKAPTVTAVSCPVSVVYTGSAQTPCTVAVTGANLSITPDPVYANNTEAGVNTASASYSYVESTNHLASSDSKNFTIAKAPTVTAVSCPVSVVYTGSAQTPCTVAVTGANLSITPDPVYANNTEAGVNTASASYSYVESANHLASSDSKNFTIAKAPTTTVVSCSAGPFTYTGTAQTPCTVSVTGANLSITPDPVYASNTDAGTATASYTYAESANHLTSSDSKNFTIAKAPTVTAVSCPVSVVYTGSAQTSCTVAVTGANLSLTPTPVYASNTDAGTATASYMYAESANHLTSSDSKTFTILKASSTVTVSALTVQYDGAAHPTTAVVAGVGTGITQTVTWGYSGACSAAPVTVPSTPCTATATYAGDGNHNGSTGFNTITITTKPLTIGVTPVSKNFGNVTPLSFTPSYGVFAAAEGPGVLSGSPTFTPGAGTFNNTTFAGVYPITPSGLSSPNYNITFVPGNLTIVDGTKPVVSLTNATPNPVAINLPITITANVSDAATGNSNITSACYRIDGGTCVPMTGAFGSPTVNVTGTIPASNIADVFEVCVYGTDAGGNTNDKMDCVLIARYDPSAGFVTGGGWINSPTGAYYANPSLVGKANFGFVAKYKKGQQAPEGNTEFQFQTAGLNFKATLYDWLVIAGTKAQYKGVGTVNGTAGYGFMLTAIDGDDGAKKPDTFRMKIWLVSTGAIVYDNQLGASDTGDPSTILSGGTIVIHSK